MNLSSWTVPMDLGPGRGCHDAIRSLHNYLYKHEVQTVLDVDLENFFRHNRSQIAGRLVKGENQGINGYSVTLPVCSKPEC